MYHRRVQCVTAQLYNHGTCLGCSLGAIRVDDNRDSRTEQNRGESGTTGRDKRTHPTSAGIYHPLAFAFYFSIVLFSPSCPLLFCPMHMCFSTCFMSVYSVHFEHLSSRSSLLRLFGMFDFCPCLLRVEVIQSSSNWSFP